ncbi:MAG: hypothetical protein DMG86_10330 [Acidobacteria bacterium]|nr:MAG: hypothetical protein DMG86_10330 [Acidobacteriota bacterium]
MAVPLPASRKATEITNTGCGHSSPNKIPKPAVRPVTQLTWCWSAAMWDGTSAKARISSGKEDASAAIVTLETEKAQNSKQAAELMKQADTAQSNEEANRLNDKAIALKVSNSKIDGHIQQLDFQSHSLLQDVKKVGPNLKDVRLKLNRNWIPVWLKKPTDFRPTTKMPNFRLSDQQIRAISAYIWQSGFKDPLPKQNPGNAEHGKELFETRGCMACHSIGEGDQMQGGTFAANLTRVGEKANFDYLVRWVHNARQRTRPYCPLEKKDIGPEDYAKKGLRYVFDLEHSQCRRT